MTHPQTSSEWDERYSEKERLWSGNPNAMLVRFADQFDSGPGGQGRSALDVGCGEGADAIWLARQGRNVTGIDLSTVAIQRAKESAAVLNLDAQFHATDAIEYASHVGSKFDVVTVSFMHSRDEDQRAETMRAIPSFVKPGGQLLVISHAAMPPWSRHHEHEDRSPRPTFDITAASEIEALGLDDTWEIQVAQELERPATGPDGEEAVLLDAVVLARRGI